MEARRALAALRALLAELGLAPKEAKTRVVHLREGGGASEGAASAAADALGGMARDVAVRVLADRLGRL